MDTELTLKFDQYIIEKAKEYAKSKKISLSEIIESYLKFLIDKDEINIQDDIQISPFVKSLRTGVKLPHDINDKEVYRNYVSEKQR